MPPKTRGSSGVKTRGRKNKTPGARSSPIRKKKSIKSTSDDDVAAAAAVKVKPSEPDWPPEEIKAIARRHGLTADQYMDALMAKHQRDIEAENKFAKVVADAFSKPTKPVELLKMCNEDGPEVPGSGSTYCPGPYSEEEKESFMSSFAEFAAPPSIQSSATIADPGGMLPKQTVHAPPPILPQPMTVTAPPSIQSSTTAAAAAATTTTFTTPQATTAKFPPAVRSKKVQSPQQWREKAEEAWCQTHDPLGEDTLDSDVIFSDDNTDGVWKTVPFNHPNQPSSVDEKRALVYNNLPPPTLSRRWEAGAAPPAAALHDVRPASAAAAAVAAAPNNDSWMDATVQNFLKTEEGKEQQMKSAVTVKHAAERFRVFENLLQFILTKGGDVLKLPEEQLKLVPGPFYSPRLVPQVVLDLGGARTTNKLRLTNIILCQWVLQLKNEKNPDQFLQPSTHARKLRTLLGHMKQEYGWDYSLDDDFNYQGGIKAVISSMFDERRRESEQNPVRNPYGVGANKQVITTVSSVTQLKWDVFDESILSEFMAKLMAIFGCYFGFRGRKEHALMTVNNLTHGKFEEGHPFAGHMYYGVQNLFDKSTKLTLNNQYARVDENRQRIPVIDVNDQNDPGGTIHRYLELISPGQQRLYCYEATKEERAKWQHVYPNARFSPNKPLGENAVAVKMKVASKKLGLGELGGHAFRRLCGTTLNNAEGVSVEEALGTMRHNSVSATRAYIVRDNVSEAKKFKAYGLEPKKKNN